MQFTEKFTPFYLKRLLVHIGEFLGGALIITWVIVGILFTTNSPDKSTTAVDEASTQLITVDRPIPFETVTVTKNDLPKDVSEIKTAGVNGTAALTYRVTFVGAVGKTKMLVKKTVKTPPITQIVFVGPGTSTSNTTRRTTTGGDEPIISQTDGEESNACDGTSCSEDDPTCDEETCEVEAIDCVAEPEFCEKP